MKFLQLSIIFFITSLPVLPQTHLSPGDLSIISVNADGNKSFSVLFIREIEAGTTLYFTDDAWMNSDNGFRGSEGILTYTAASILPAGSVITCPSKDGGNGFVESGSFNPAGSGDNIIVYQGSKEDPFFIYGIGWARGASVWEYSDVSASYRSDVPPGLSLSDGTVVGLGTRDDYVYSGTRYLVSGTRGELLAELGNSDNYASSNSDEQVWTNGDFLIGGDVTADQGGLLRPGALGLGLKAGAKLKSSVLWSEVSWTNGEPGRFSEVEIGEYVVLDQAVVVHDLVVKSGGFLEILPGASLTVFGKLTNNNGVSGLVVKADETGSGALYSSTEGVDGSVEVYLTPDQWHFVSPPVTSTQTIEQIFGSPDSHLYGVYEFDEPSMQWLSGNDQLSTKNLKGYNVKYQNTSKTIQFTGALNNFRTRRSITVSRGAGGGWNLIGNPFPAPMDWKGSVKKDGLEHETIYVTTGGSGGDTSWDTFNGTSGVGVPSDDVGNVAVGQAFWVRSGASGGSVALGCYAKTSAGSSFKHGAPDAMFDHVQPGPSLRWDDSRVVSVIRLVLSNADGQNDELAICFDENGTEGFDEYDSEKMGWNESKDLGIAIPIENKHCIIASYPNLSTLQLFNPSTTKIPIEILPSEGLQSLRMLRGLEQFASIILEDRALGIVHDLSIQPVYEFHAEGGLSAGGSRFLLHFAWDVGGAELTNIDSVEELKGYRVEGFLSLGGQLFDCLDGLSAGVYFQVGSEEGRRVVTKIFFDGH